ncbi:MAG: hypothetical protein H7Z37_17425 [Pyrinomonadaceae bacterium]|nr:hypothetical protein [Pyrinomonadaceae bacterium]
MKAGERLFDFRDDEVYHLTTSNILIAFNDTGQHIFSQRKSAAIGKMLRIFVCLMCRHYLTKTASGMFGAMPPFE